MGREASQMPEGGGSGLVFGTPGRDQREGLWGHQAGVGVPGVARWRMNVRPSEAVNLRALAAGAATSAERGRRRGRGGGGAGGEEWVLDSDWLLRLVESVEKEERLQAQGEEEGEGIQERNRAQENEGAGDVDNQGRTVGSDADVASRDACAGLVRMGAVQRLVFLLSQVYPCPDSQTGEGQSVIARGNHSLRYLDATQGGCNVHLRRAFSKQCTSNTSVYCLGNVACFNVIQTWSVVSTHSLQSHHTGFGCAISLRRVIAQSEHSHTGTPREVRGTILYKQSRRVTQATLTHTECDCSHYSGFVCTWHLCYLWSLY